MPEESRELESEPAPPRPTSSTTDLETEESDAQELAVWLTCLHRSLDLNETIRSIVDETRAWSGWDRVSLALPDGTVCRIEAISGLDSLDRRSAAARELGAVHQAALSADPTAIHHARRDSPPDLDSAPLAEYRERVGAEEVVLMPLQAKTGEVLGRIGFERFGPGSGNRKSVAQLERAAGLATVALDHALEHRRALTDPVTKLLNRFRVRPVAVTAMTLAGILAVLMFVRTDIVVSGTAILQPKRQRDVFAGINGVVEELHVRHGQEVSPGDPLLTLSSSELDLEIQRVSGERSTVQRQIADLETLRTAPGRARGGAGSGDEMAARGEELKTVLDNLQSQLAVLHRQQQGLVIRSPIAGRVISSNLDALLAERPVTRTDRLLTIANLNDPWLVHIHVDSRDWGPVLQAVEAGALEVTFWDASEAHVRHDAELIEVAQAVRIDPLQGTTLTITAQIDEANPDQFRPGMSVVPRLKCGSGALGSVWFRRFLDRLATWWSLLS